MAERLSRATHVTLLACFALAAHLRWLRLLFTDTLFRFSHPEWLAAIVVTMAVVVSSAARLVATSIVVKISVVANERLVKDTCALLSHQACVVLLTVGTARHVPVLRLAHHLASSVEGLGLVGISLLVSRFHAFRITILVEQFIVTRATG